MNRGDTERESGCVCWQESGQAALRLNEKAEEKSMKRLAVLFPGIGYSAEKPLLYYSRRIAERFGYEKIILTYTGFPKRIRGDEKKMRKAISIARRQAQDMLSGIDWSAYEDVLLIGKSIGTVVAGEIAATCPTKAQFRFLLYTPLEETFAFPLGNAVVFTGTDDPWVGGAMSRIPALCGQKAIRCFTYERANHSLETADPMKDIQNLQSIMDHTTAFIREEQLRRIRYYEQHLRELERLASSPNTDGKSTRMAGEKAAVLEQYYGSDDWKLDFADDEAGALPADLPRGVLSEDGIFNALDAYRETVAGGFTALQTAEEDWLKLRCLQQRPLQNPGTMIE